MRANKTLHGEYLSWAISKSFVWCLFWNLGEQNKSSVLPARVAWVSGWFWLPLCASVVSGHPLVLQHKYPTGFPHLYAFPFPFKFFALLSVCFKFPHAPVLSASAELKPALIWIKQWKPFRKIKLFWDAVVSNRLTYPYHSFRVWENQVQNCVVVT